MGRGLQGLQGAVEPSDPHNSLLACSLEVSFFTSGRQKGTQAAMIVVLTSAWERTSTTAISYGLVVPWSWEQRAVFAMLLLRRYEAEGV